MKFACTLNEAQQIVPVVEGVILRIYDAHIEESTDYPNPFCLTKRNNHQLVWNFVKTRGSHYFVQPVGSEQAFEELTYYPVAQQTTFDEFKESLK